MSAPPAPLRSSPPLPRLPPRQPLSLSPPSLLRGAGGGFLFAVEDLERNDGSAEKPYFMSPDLKKLLKKTNKGQPDT